MKCLKCDKEMDLAEEDFSYNFKANPKKKYERKVFHCKKCDVWINIEIPSSK